MSTLSTEKSVFDFSKTMDAWMAACEKGFKRDGGRICKDIPPFKKATLTRYARFFRNDFLVGLQADKPEIGKDCHDYCQAISEEWFEEWINERWPNDHGQRVGCYRAWVAFWIYWGAQFQRSSSSAASRSSTGSASSAPPPPRRSASAPPPKSKATTTTTTAAAAATTTSSKAAGSRGSRAASAPPSPPPGPPPAWALETAAARGCLRAASELKADV